MTALKRMREARGISRRQISEQCGINLRSLQDYEQGHKDISRANGALLYKLALALGCHIEEILDPYLLLEAKSIEEGPGADKAAPKSVMKKPAPDQAAPNFMMEMQDSFPETWDFIWEKPAPDRAGRAGQSSGKRNGIQAEYETGNPLRERLLESCFYSERYRLCGRWAEVGGSLVIVFAYGGEIVKIPFPGLVTDQTMPWLPGAAVMLMEDYVEDMLFMQVSRKAMEKSSAEAWDEW